MIKLKDLLKESYALERKFGEKLPTLADVQKKHLSEGKWKARGKYLTAPTGEDMSIPKRNDRDRIVIKAKGETFQFYDNGFEEYNIMGSRNSYHPKGKKDLVRFLNKFKAQYVGID